MWDDTLKWNRVKPQSRRTPLERLGDNSVRVDALVPVNNVDCVVNQS